MRSFGMSENDVQQYIERSKFITSEVSEGEYSVVLEVDGKKFEKTATILKDLWYTNE